MKWRNNRTDTCLLDLLNNEFNTFAKTENEKVNLEYDYG